MIFQACRNSSDAFLNQNKEADSTGASVQDIAFLHQKYMNHLIAELKPNLTEIIKQGITSGDIDFEYPAALAEIVLIVLAVKLNHTFLSATAEDSEETIRGLVALLEKGTGVPQGTLNYLTPPADGETFRSEHPCRMLYKKRSTTFSFLPFLLYSCAAYLHYFDHSLSQQVKSRQDISQVPVCNACP